jgi:syntaxin 16
MTKKVKQAEENIHILSKIHLQSSTEQNVKENIKLNLATKIKEFTRDFRMNEEKYMKNYQELVGDPTKYNIMEIEDLDGDSFSKGGKSKFSTSHNSFSSGQNDFLQTTVKEDIIMKKRDEEISTLLSSITELAGVFKDLQTLVQHQGTILDRIDYNIDNALEDTKKANKELVETEKMQKNSCYRNTILVLLISIFIMALLLVFKFFK